MTRAAGKLDVEVKAMAGWPVAAVRAASHSLDLRVAATPGSRDRTVDLMRAVSITVVVLWHWTGSVTHRRDGVIVMPNPVDQVPLLWLATWLGQVMPVFFLVGGFANLAAWDRVEGSTRAFLRLRLTRLLRPTAVFLGVWAVLEVLLLVAVPDYPGVLSYGLVVAVPLWFLAAYVWVVLVVPLTAVAHRRAALPTVVLLGMGVARWTQRGSAPAWSPSVSSTPASYGYSCTSSATCGATGCSTPRAGGGRSPRPAQPA